LRDLGQLQAVALLAYEQRLSFEFDRTPEGISVLLFRRGIKPAGGLYADDGVGI
jgi:sulfate adenylyltransferase subunit 1